MEQHTAEENFIDFKCPYCGETLSFLESYAGSAQGCPSCMEGVIVPNESVEFGGKMPSAVTSPRLLLRRFKPGDWKDLLEIMSDPEVLHYVHYNLLDELGVERWIESERDARI